MDADDQDRLVLEELEDAGSDLSLPHVLDFYLYLPSEAPARFAASILQSAGFQTVVRPAALGGGELCLATREMVPSLANIRSERKRFEDLASEFRGEFDGWEAAVRKT